MSGIYLSILCDSPNFDLSSVILCLLECLYCFSEISNLLPRIFLKLYLYKRLSFSKISSIGMTTLVCTSFPLVRSPTSNPGPTNSIVTSLFLSITTVAPPKVWYLGIYWPSKSKVGCLKIKMIPSSDIFFISFIKAIISIALRSLPLGNLFPMPFGASGLHKYLSSKSGKSIESLIDEHTQP